MKTHIQMASRRRPGPDNFGEFSQSRNPQRNARRKTMKKLGGVRQLKRAKRLNAMLRKLDL